jgi:nicotinate phosphoribosyltransferase
MAQTGAFRSGPMTLEDAALLTDLYEVTMAASYWRERMRELATFSLFVRRLPERRSFLVAAGLADIVGYLQSFGFTPPGLVYLRSLGLFSDAFLEFLGEVRFSGTVRAVPEGTVVFPNEPLVEVTAPIIEAQLVESAVINLCHAQTTVASKAIRSVLAARGRAVIEFGLRRTPGLEAGMKAARASWIAGAAQTSNVLAGLHYAIPPSGTMAHSYVSAFPSEQAAFRAFADTFPDRAVLLLDTYDTVSAAHKAVEVARALAARGHRLAGVRLDSGDLAELSVAVRRILDQAELPYVRIIASGNLDEDAVDQLVAAGAPIDAFGIGTRMDVSADAPYLDMAYKLVRYDGRDVLKLSAGKETWTGEKQVWRFRTPGGSAAEDLLALREEPAPVGGEPLMAEVMRSGRLVRPLPALIQVRARCAAEVAALPERVRSLHGADRYPVRYSACLLARQAELEAEVRARESAAEPEPPFAFQSRSAP